MRRARASLVVAAALALAGCASPPPPPGQVLASEALAFLIDGKTTREDVTLRLGLPSRTFESDRIVLYRIGWSEKRGPYALAYPTAPVYDLVLVFDAHDVVDRHALVAK